MALPRAVAATLLGAAVLVVVGLGLVVALDRQPPPADPRPADPSHPAVGGSSAGREELAAALDVLRRWDERRASAYASGDVRALRRLYVPGSAAGAGDTRLLRSYAERGLVVEGMRMQVVEADVVRLSPARIVLRVRDRVVGATAVSTEDHTERRALPRDNASVHEVTMVRRGDGWRVASVRTG